MTFFPPDVSLRVDPSADVNAAQALFPAAKQLLFRALNMKEAGVPVVKLFQPGTDGSLIYVYLIGDLKHIYVQPAKRQIAEGVVVVEPLVVTAFACPDVLSGVVHPGDAVVVSTDPITDIVQYSVHEFHPSQISAETYSLDFSWQDIERLAVETDPAVSTTSNMQVRWPKPSMYSGAMKRVVQAIYGIGKTSFVDNTDPNKQVVADIDVQNHYHYRWDKTDGIFKFNDEFWVIRIGKDDGILAQRMGLFECTTGGGFSDALQSSGDTETYEIVAEFGGLPTGEDFPSDIEAAVKEGGVLRLLTVDQIAPFYRDADSEIKKSGFFAGCGWAFSDSGMATSAHNTCWWYSRPDIVAMPFHMWSTDGFNNASPLHRYMRAEHWKVEFIFATDSVGDVSASAKLSLVEEQPLEAPNSTWLVDVDESHPLASSAVGHVPVTGMVGRSGTHGETTTDTGYLYASGMNPIRFPSSFTPRLRSGGPSGEQAAFLSHGAFMAAPRDDASDRLYRFEFWGRSQSGIHVVDMEVAYEAPVMVFYVGEELEIVRRKAERYLSDRETVTYDDVVPGTYYPGDFFATSLNLLDPVRTSIQTSPGTVSRNPIPGFYRGTPQFSIVGLIVPAGCREGYVFVKVAYDETKVVGAETTTYTGFFSDLGIVPLKEYVSDHNVTYLVPNFGPFYLGIYELSVMPGWWSMWTNVYFDWNLGTNPIGFRCAVSNSAFSINTAMHAEPQLGWRLLDVPFNYRLSLDAPFSVSLRGLPPEYRYVLPDGIELENANPTEVTFVGGL